MDDLAEARTYQESMRQSEHTLNQSFAPSTTVPAQDRPLVMVYSPKAVFWVTFLMNVLGGFILSAINWSRLESGVKARVHVLIGAIVFIGLAALIAWAPIGSFVVLLINLAVAFYLRYATQQDIDDDAGTVRVDYINGWAAFGIGLMGTVVMVILVAILKPVMPS